MKENKVLKKRKHHKFGYYIIRLAFAFILFGVCMYFSFAKDGVVGVSLRSDGKIGYKINLKDNSYYDTDELPEDMDYVASLIDYIDANVEYSLSASNQLDYNYTYSIDAIVKVYGDSDSKPLITKTYPLLENKTLELNNTSNLNISEKVYLDYNEYNQFVANYKTSFLLSNNADLTLKLTVKTNAVSNELGASEEISDEISMVLPLTETVISSSNSTTAGNNYFITPDTDEKAIQNIYVFVVAIFFGLLFIFYFIKAILDTDDVKGMAYRKELKKILNMYDLIIVNVETLLDEHNYETVIVSSFNELKDVHDNVGNPIMFKEVAKNKKSVFLILKDGILYKYVLNSVE